MMSGSARAWDRKPNYMALMAAIALAISLSSLPLPWLMAYDEDARQSWSVTGLGRGEARARLSQVRGTEFSFTYSFYPLGTMAFSSLIIALFFSLLDIFNPPSRPVRAIVYAALALSLSAGIAYLALLVAGVGAFSGLVIIYIWPPSEIVIKHEDIRASEVWAEAEALWPGVGFPLFITSVLVAFLLHRSAWPKPG